MRFLLVTLLSLASATAQYRTESYPLTAGWNPIYLNVDTELRPLDLVLAGNPDILEVWEWRPNGLDPKLTVSSVESEVADEWKTWRRGDAANTSFVTFSANSAYLIRLKNGAPAQTLEIKGKVVAPRVQWRTDGANLIGFPIKSGATPKLSRYLGGAGLVDNNTEVYRYGLGALSVTNPAAVPARFINASRGQAYWVRSDEFTDFYGPIQASVVLDDGLSFGASGVTKRLTLKNRTAADVTVTLATVPSEAAPGASSALAIPGLTTRSRDGNGLFIYPPLPSTTTLTIPAESSSSLTLGIDRSRLAVAAGTQFSGLLKITDGDDLTEIYLPITAEKGSLAGLWVGEAIIGRVQNQLERFEKDNEGNYRIRADGKYIAVDSETGVNPTAQTFPLKLLVHVDAAGRATLLSEVHAGVISVTASGDLITGVSTDESELHRESLASAIRLSATHLPTGLAESMTGQLAPGSALASTVSLGANHHTNPFIHSYHPDHDNKDARFESTLPAGIESHQVDRTITLTFRSEALPGEGPQWGSTLLSGTYSEEVSGLHKNSILAEGIFALVKVNDNAVLSGSPHPPN